MANLNFTRHEQVLGKDAAWVAEVSVTADFNLHVERVAGGRFLVYQSTDTNAGAQYDIVDGVGNLSHKDVIDLDFVAAIYPKMVKIVSASEVTKGVITLAE